jgi:SPBc2 prophage-derived uncharacterized protein yonV
MKINVIDDICGKGKTNYIIREMQEGIAQGKQYIYVTPFLDEIDNRITKEIPEIEAPKKKTTKMSSLIQLLEEGKSIATTHTLFKMLNKDILKILKNNNYILIIDETLDVIEQIGVTKRDLDIIIDLFADVNADNKITWKDKYYRGKFESYKELADTDNLYLYKDKDGNAVTLFWQFPHQIFSAFKEAWILTYMFDCQLFAMYLKSYGYTYQKHTLNSQSQLTNYTFNRLDKSLFNILQGDAYNAFGDGRTSLSKAWLQRKENGKSIATNAEIARKKMYGLCRNGCKAWNIKQIKAKDMIWTTYKDSVLKGSETGIYLPSYKSSWIALNSRATNKYNDRHYILYGCNLFFNPLLKQYFQQQNITVNEDDWALSMLVQFVCRSAMRKGEKVYLYIPSSRMRNMFMDYLGM